MPTKYKLSKVVSRDAPNFTMNPAELYQYLPENVDFKVKRIYWLTNPKGEKKSGQHAHTDEDEIFVVLKGEASIVLDEGSGKETLPLSTNDFIWVPRYVWHGFEKLSDDSIVLALSSTNYDPERKGYVEDYEKFKQLVLKA